MLCSHTGKDFTTENYLLLQWKWNLQSHASPFRLNCKLAWLTRSWRVPATLQPKFSSPFHHTMSSSLQEVSHKPPQAVPTPPTRQPFAPGQSHFLLLFPLQLSSDFTSPWPPFVPWWRLCVPLDASTIPVLSPSQLSCPVMNCPLNCLYPSLSPLETLAVCLIHLLSLLLSSGSTEMWKKWNKWQNVRYFQEKELRWSLTGVYLQKETVTL